MWGERWGGGGPGEPSACGPRLPTGVLTTYTPPARGLGGLVGGSRHWGYLVGVLSTRESYYLGSIYYFRGRFLLQSCPSFLRSLQSLEGRFLEVVPLKSYTGFSHSSHTYPKTRSNTIYCVSTGFPGCPL